MSDRIPMTQVGYNKILAEVEQLENEEMPKIEKRIAAARAEGDLSENAEYHGARESQGMLQAKINMLKGKLAMADIIDTSKLPKDEVAFGARVVVKDLDFNDVIFKELSSCDPPSILHGRFSHNQDDSGQIGGAP